MSETAPNAMAGKTPYDIIHHGAINGVTGSCHELRASEQEAILIDCGLFQGLEAEFETTNNSHGQDGNPLISENIPFAINHIKALIVTHVHIDHVGRIPHLLAAGFKGPIYCTEPSAKLLPLVLEDAVKVGFTRNKALIARFVNTLKEYIVPVPYGKWQQASPNIKIKFKPAGHILGSAYITCKLSSVGGHPVPESFKNTLDENPKPVRARTRGRTSEQNPNWQDLEIIIDSPLAAKFTQTYGQLKKYWDKEAHRKLKQGRHPLSFDNVLTINSHKDHLNTVQYLAKTHRPAIVIAASGMCNGGRVMSYLKAMLHDIQKYGPRQGYVNIDGQKININAGVYTISGYSAHAGQSDLLKFVKRMWFKPKEIRLIHGDDAAKQTLRQKLKHKHPNINVWIP